jgi:hypothetical protein
MLAIDPRSGGATSNCAADNIVLLDLAVSRLPGGYRHVCTHTPRVLSGLVCRTTREGHLAGRPSLAVGLLDVAVDGLVVTVVTTSLPVPGTPEHTRWLGLPGPHREHAGLIQRGGTELADDGVVSVRPARRSGNTPL